MKGNVAKAENIINSLKFASYDENNLCDLKEGIPDNEYDATVDEIAEQFLAGKKERRIVACLEVRKLFLEKLSVIRLIPKLL